MKKHIIEVNERLESDTVISSYFWITKNMFCRVIRRWFRYDNKHLKRDNKAIFSKIVTSHFTNLHHRQRGSRCSVVKSYSITPKQAISYSSYIPIPRLCILMAEFVSSNSFFTVQKISMLWAMNSAMLLIISNCNVMLDLFSESSCSGYTPTYKDVHFPRSDRSPSKDTWG